MLATWGLGVFYLDASPEQASLVLLFTSMQGMIIRQDFLLLEVIHHLVPHPFDTHVELVTSVSVSF